MIPSYSPQRHQVINFGKQKGKDIIANFDGGLITSDAGIIWIAELDKRLGITEKFAQCFRDYRHPCLSRQGCDLKKILDRFGRRSWTSKML